MANRYSNITPSQFQPLSLQEIMVTPLMQRQKHDQLLAQQELLKQGLAKTNPHEKYFNEAVRLKDELNNQISSQAELLAKEGVNPNSQADFLKLNRNYQETMSPTGKLGMINAHNVNLQSTYKNYIDEAIKAGQSPAIAKLHADQSIQKHLQEPLYDERGRVVDFNVGNAAPEYVDTVKWINDLATNVGFNAQDWSRASSGISQDANGRFIVNSSAKGMTKDNIENLNKLVAIANSEVSDSSSRIRQNIDYNFQNPQTELNKMINQLSARRISDRGSEQSRTYGSMDWNDGEKVNNFDSNIDSYDIGTGKLFDNNSKLMEESGLKEPTQSTGGVPGQFRLPSGKVYSKENRSEEYKKLSSQINRSLPQNQRFKIGSKEEDIAVKNYLSKYGNTVIKDRIITPHSQPSDLLFASKTLNKEKAAAQNDLWSRVKNRGAEMVDETGNVLTDKDLAQVSKFSYDGDVTADSNIKIFKKDTRQNIMPHYGTITIGKGDDAVIKRVFVSRSADDFKTPQYKGAVDKNKLNILKAQPNIYHQIKSDAVQAFKNYGMTNVEIKYNEGSQTYDLSFKDGEGRNRDLIAVKTIDGKNLSYLEDAGDLKKQKYSKTKSKNTFWTIHNSRLVILNNTRIRVVLIDAVLDDPLSLENISLCNEDGEDSGLPCFDSTTADFPMKTALNRVMYQKALEILRIPLTIPDDMRNDDVANVTAPVSNKQNAQS